MESVGAVKWATGVGDGGTHCNVPIHIQGLS